MPLADALRRHLIQQFPADRAYDRVAIYADAMPPLVAAFLDQTLDRWTALEREQLRSDWFDFEDDQVREAEARLFDALGPTARVPASAWEDTLGGAVDLVVRFLTIPARALTDAIFEGEADPLPAETVRERLDLFAAYPYLAERAAVYLDRHPAASLDPDALFALLDRADRREVVGHEPSDWIALLQPLFDLAAGVPTLGGVPAATLAAFFEAKGEGAMAERLDTHVGTTLDEAALRDLLSAEHEATATEASSEDEPIEPIATGDAGDASVPLWQRFAQESGDGSVNTRFGSDDVDPPSASDAPVPLWQRLTPAPPAPLSEPAPSPRVLDDLEERVLGRVAPERRARFVKHLFRGDAGKYATVLHALESAGSWTEASQIIARDVFRPFKVNIYGEHAVAFTDAVEARFRG